MKIQILVTFMAILTTNMLKAQKDATNISIYNEPAPFADFVLCETDPEALNMAEIQAQIHYPIDAREQGLEALVMFRILIDEQGKYIRHLPLCGADIFQKTIEPYLSQIYFSPAKQADGRAVKQWTDVKFYFALQ